MSPRELYKLQKRREIDRLSWEAERLMKEAEAIYARITLLEEETYEIAYADDRYAQWKDERDECAVLKLERDQ